mmetsp:Transcript_3897/g.9225  ORF Transcript_3897/g.9225 Transcript_3897/m.9225 type:complete len:408 (-) Transcript_3897:1376-2599(-)
MFAQARNKALRDAGSERRESRRVLLQLSGKSAPVEGASLAGLETRERREANVLLVLRGEVLAKQDVHVVTRNAAKRSDGLVTQGCVVGGQVRSYLRERLAKAQVTKSDETQLLAPGIAGSEALVSNVEHTTDTLMVLREAKREGGSDRERVSRGAVVAQGVCVGGVAHFREHAHVVEQAFGRLGQGQEAVHDHALLIVTSVAVLKEREGGVLSGSIGLGYQELEESEPLLSLRGAARKRGVVERLKVVGDVEGGVQVLAQTSHGTTRLVPTQELLDGAESRAAVVLRSDGRVVQQSIDVLSNGAGLLHIIVRVLRLEHGGVLFDRTERRHAAVLAEVVAGDGVNVSVRHALGQSCVGINHALKLLDARGVDVVLVFALDLGGDGGLAAGALDALKVERVALVPPHRH